MGRITIFITTCSIFLLLFVSISNSKEEKTWFQCCNDSAWMQLTKDIQVDLKLSEDQKAQLIALSKELEPTIREIFEKKVAQRLAYLKALDSALDDGVVTKEEKALIDQRLQELRGNRMDIISILLQGKILADTILTDSQVSSLKDVKMKVALRPKLHAALVFLQKSLDLYLENQTNKNDLQIGFEQVVDAACLPAKAKEVMTFQFNMLLKNLDFFEDEHKVQEVAGLDISLQRVKAGVDGLLDSFDKNGGAVDAMELLETISYGMGLPAVELIARFGNILRPLVVDVFLVSPVFSSCSL